MNNKVINYVQNLPDDVIRVIKEYLPITILVFTNKTNYFLYHSSLKKYISNYENYIRDAIRRDNSFVFNEIIKENYKLWLRIKNYSFKNAIYKNYIYFLLNYCIENNSSVCRLCLSDFLKQHGLCQNQHKKNIIKHIRWKN